jgi:hypothetical protein
MIAVLPQKSSPASVSRVAGSLLAPRAPSDTDDMKPQRNRSKCGCERLQPCFRSSLAEPRAGDLLLSRHVAPSLLCYPPHHTGMSSRAQLASGAAWLTEGQSDRWSWHRPGCEQCDAPALGANGSVVEVAGAGVVIQDRDLFAAYFRIPESTLAGPESTPACARGLAEEAWRGLPCARARRRSRADAPRPCIAELGPSPSGPA